MEKTEELPSARRSKLNALITSKFSPAQPLEIHREALLDTLQTLYEECSLESLRRNDPQILEFYNRFKPTIAHLKQLRVNVTDFEVKSVIGRGHFGQVHLVKEKVSGSVYAMKTIKKSECLQKSTSFVTERDIMAMAHQSPWLTSLQYAFQDQSYLFYVMEYHPGGDLLGLLYRQGGTLPESAATFYLAELVLALDDLHAMGYVHRDIKPDNVLLDRCGHLKLADFGSAAQLNKAGLVCEGAPVGTPDYIAPEVLKFAEKSGKGYGSACDFWSLGVLAYELVVGKAPFASQSTTLTYSKIMGEISLKFPADLLLTHAYIDFIRNLVTDEAKRMTSTRVKQHALFRNIQFECLRDQVPPYVPKIVGQDDTSNFSDALATEAVRNVPDIGNFKKRVHFTGRNLPFIGFTFMQEAGMQEIRASNAKNDVIKALKSELDERKRNLVKYNDIEQEKLQLEKKLLEKTQKIETVEAIRTKLERDLATSLAEMGALKRTLEIERKDRAELEKKALDLIKQAKIKWETAERNKIESLSLEIRQQQEKMAQLQTSNQLLNEQLQHAFKMEDKHRQSIEMVDKLNRRSVIGLESRLEQITMETKETIGELREQLNEANHQRNELELKLLTTNEDRKQLLKELQESERNYGDLKRNVDEAEKTIRDLSCKVNQLEIDVNEADKLKKQLKEQAEEVKQMQGRLKEVEMRNFLLDNQLKQAEKVKNELEESNARKIAELNGKISDLERKLVQVEEEKQMQAKKQVPIVSEEVLDEAQQLKEMRMRVWKLEKDYSNCKIDKRILERELKESETKSKQLQQELKQLQQEKEEQTKNHEKALLELNNINESVSLELIRAQQQCSKYEEQIQSEQFKYNEQKLILADFENVISAKNAKIHQFDTTVKQMSIEKQVLENRCSDLQHEKDRLLNELSEVRKEIAKIKNVNDGLAQQVQNTTLNLDALREACTLLETQIVEYENLCEKLSQEKSSLSENVEKLIKDVLAAKEDVQQARKQTNEEKSAKILLEMQLKRAHDDLNSVKSELDDAKRQIDDLKVHSTQLCDELALLEEKNSDLEVTLCAQERQIDNLQCESNGLKEEISHYLTQMAAMKQTNYQLREQVKELRASEVDLMEKIDELERRLMCKVGFYEEREMKNAVVMGQQAKLIEYLQVKIDENANKKKTLSTILFGHSKKENQAPNTLKTSTTDLEKEKKQNRALQEEIYRLKTEMALIRNDKIAQKINGGLQRAKSDIVVRSPTKTAQNEETQPENLNISTKIQLPNATQANCVLDLTKNIKIIACTNGLYSYFNNVLLKINGLDEGIKKLVIVAGTNAVVMIANKSNELIQCDLNHLINLTQCAPITKPEIITRKIVLPSNLHQFQFLHASNRSRQQMFCAATRRQLILAKFNVDQGEFVPLRVMDTAEPVQCALFTEHSLIVGADKLFEIDLITFEAEEFLDASDQVLQPAINCHKMRSWPMEVVQVTTNPKEYVVCFKELVVFVDEYGRSSRKEEWAPSCVPLAFCYCAPFLYVFQFEAVELVRIDGEKVKMSGRIELKDVKVVGVGRSGIYVEKAEGAVWLLEGRKLLGDEHEDVVSLTSVESGEKRDEEEEEEDRFSFTSSMMQSLDGEDEFEVRKKVHFSQTNL